MTLRVTFKARRLPRQSFSVGGLCSPARGWVQIATPLSLDTKGGRQQINCANTEGIFRIIQSIPLPKSEPLKRWLAKVGYELMLLS